MKPDPTEPPASAEAVAEASGWGERLAGEWLKAYRRGRLGEALPRILAECREEALRLWAAGDLRGAAARLWGAALAAAGLALGEPVWSRASAEGALARAPDPPRRLLRELLDLAHVIRALAEEGSYSPELMLERWTEAHALLERALAVSPAGGSRAAGQTASLSGGRFTLLRAAARRMAAAAAARARVRLRRESASPRGPPTRDR